ncbi:MAG TPA: FUSC family protein, partial [Acidimicrobiales bacterium]|nr:FUSC family protein [Acidimicrobiales bacterium]
SSWRSLAQAAVRLDRDRIELGGAVRCTIGVVIPLVVGLATGAVADGVAAAVGALCAGFGSFQGAYRSRVWVTLAVAGGMGISTVVGSLADRHAISAVLVAAAWGAMAGMMASLGQGALVTGLQWVVAELIVGVIPMTGTQAVVRGAMILAGGVLQAVLVVVLWPFGTYVVERRALQAALSSLASFAEAVADGADLGQAAASLDEARAVFGDPQPFSNATRLMAFQALVDEAERVRLQLVVLAQHRSRLSATPSDVLDRLLGHGAVVLRCVARALGRDEEPRLPFDVTDTLGHDGEELRTTLEASGEAPWLAIGIETAAAALAGQLRSAVRLSLASMGQSDLTMTESQALPMRRHVLVRESVATLVANVSWQSATFRHALRLAVTLAVATATYRWSGLPHGYWIPLTALVVLRPDFASTAVRGLSRVAGTIVGAGVATLLTAAIRPDQTGLAVLFALASFFAFLVLRANYAVFSVAVTSYVVFLLAFVKLPEMTAVSDRLADTLIGGALAIAVYLLWPTWESRLVGPQLARLLDAQADYSSAVLSVWVEPPTDRRHLGELRAAARLARSNAEASLDRMTAEPNRALRSARLGLDQARGVVSAARSNSSAILSLQARLPPPDAPSLPEAGPLAEAIPARARAQADQLGSLAGETLDGPGEDGGSVSRRDGDDGGASSAQSATAHRSLRGLHSEMAERLRSRVTGMDDRTALLVEETDLLVDSLNMISEILERSAAEP